MPTVSAPAPARKTRTRKPVARSIWLDPVPADPDCRHVRITVGKTAVDYWLEPAPADFGTAYKLSKFAAGGGDPEESEYHVHFDPDGTRSCPCKGHQRHGHCKHADGLAKLRELGLI